MRTRFSLRQLAAPIALVVSIMALGAPAGAQRSTTTYRYSGAFASVYFEADAAQLFCWVDVSRGILNRASQTYLSYACFDGATWQAVLNGSGRIPNSHFKVTGSTATLQTDTGSNPDFQHWSGVGGPVAFTWTKNGLFSESYSGRSSVQMPGMKVKQHGTWQASEARAVGELAGIPLAAINSATVGVNKEVSVTIQR